MPQRHFYSVFSSDLARSADWYESLFGYEPVFESDWFVHLQDPTNGSLEMGILDRDHEIVPERFRASPGGGMLTIVVDDVDALHQRAVTAGIEIVEPPTDLFYGQRRMLLVDPDGLLVDTSTECDPDPDWVATLS